MFENPGGKIKGLAVAAFAVEALGSFITGIVLWEDLGALALLIMLGGILVAYVTALLFYGFGELIESSTQSRDLLLAGEEREKEKSKQAFDPQPAVKKPAPVAAPSPNAVKPAMVQPKTVVAEAKPVDENMIACGACGTVQRKNRNICFNCGVSLQKDP